MFRGGCLQGIKTSLLYAKKRKPHTKNRINKKQRTITKRYAPYLQINLYISTKPVSTVMYTDPMRGRAEGVLYTKKSADADINELA